MSTYERTEMLSDPVFSELAINKVTKSCMSKRAIQNTK